MKKLIFSLAFLLACSSCYLKSYPVTPTVAESGTYEVYRDNVQGTAWAVDSHHMITAGHMCESFTTSYIAVSSNDRRISARPVQWEKSITSGLTDLCLLATEAELRNPLVIADEMPKVGDKVGYVGYPLSVFVSEDGVYLGDLDGPEDHDDDDVFTAACNHGASGSAVFTSRGVWGVLVRLRTDGGMIHDGSDGCVAIPLKQLKAFLDDGGVKYVTTPDDPSNSKD